MFPWLFPYGLGGITSTNHAPGTFSESAHVKFLLLYHDKRFQLDQSFPFVAFSHRQVKGGTSQSYLLAESKKFDSISSRFLSIDKNVLQDISSRMVNGEFVKPSN